MRRGSLFAVMGILLTGSVCAKEPIRPEFVVDPNRYPLVVVVPPPVPAPPIQVQPNPPPPPLTPQQLSLMLQALPPETIAAMNDALPY